MQKNLLPHLHSLSSGTYTHKWNLLSVLFSKWIVLPLSLSTYERCFSSFIHYLWGPVLVTVQVNSCLSSAEEARTGLNSQVQPHHGWVEGRITAFDLLLVLLMQPGCCWPFSPWEHTVHLWSACSVRTQIFSSAKLPSGFSAARMYWCLSCSSPGAILCSYPFWT